MQSRPGRSRRILLLIAAAVILATAVGVAGHRGNPAAHGGVVGPGSRELVVLVHGMGRTSASMAPLAWSLERQGFEVLNWGYSSTCCTVAELGARLVEELGAQRAIGHERVHFVGHSLGTVIIRWVLANDTAAVPVGRIVMLAPPNRGSHEADRLAGRLGGVLKPLPELRTTPTSTTRLLTLPPDVEVGVIAGRYDGKVSVAETHLPGEKAHVIVPATHSFLMLRLDVADLTARFLRSGSFAAPGPD